MQIKTGKYTLKYYLAIASVTLVILGVVTAAIISAVNGDPGGLYFIGIIGAIALFVWGVITIVEEKDWFY